MQKQIRTVYKRNATREVPMRKSRKIVRVVVPSGLIMFGIFGLLVAHGAHSVEPTPTVQAQHSASQTSSACAGNRLANYIVVSISKQHLWACGGSFEKYNSPVVTGMEQYAADLTPPGTYQIYAKRANLNLQGCDNTGCWNDPVSYWMPFLNNQYGQYGFHDATWRSPSEFGKVNINAPSTAPQHGSHGCVELPLPTAKWLYNWAPVGTTVTIKN